MYFNEELNYLRDKEEVNKRELISEEQARNILNLYPNIPTDYVNYLVEVGFGSILNSTFNVYSSLIDFTDLGLEDVYDLPEGIKLFGDNFSGDFVGFDLSKTDSNEVVEFWHEERKMYYTDKSFRQYIREKMLMS